MVSMTTMGLSQITPVRAHSLNLCCGKEEGDLKGGGTEDCYLLGFKLRDYPPLQSDRANRFSDDIWVPSAMGK